MCMPVHGSLFDIALPDNTVKYLFWDDQGKIG